MHGFHISSEYSDMTTHRASVRQFVPPGRRVAGGDGAVQLVDRPQPQELVPRLRIYAHIRGKYQCACNMRANARVGNDWSSPYIYATAARRPTKRSCTGRGCHSCPDVPVPAVHTYVRYSQTVTNARIVHVLEARRSIGEYGKICTSY